MNIPSKYTPVFKGSDIDYVRLHWSEESTCPSEALYGLELAYFFDALQRWKSRFTYNGPRAKPLSLSLVDGCLTLTAGLCSYAKAQALYETFNRFEYLKPSGPFSGALDPRKTTSCGVGLFIISEDSKVLFVKRSTLLHRFPGVWTPLLGEGLEPTDFQEKGFPEVVCRALYEELGVSLHPKDIPWRILSLDLEADTYVLEFRVLVDFRTAPVRLNSESLANSAIYAPDAHEHECLTFKSLNELVQDDSELMQMSPKHPSWDLDLTLMRSLFSQ